MKTLIILIIAALFSGCVYTKYTGKNGVGMTRISVFGNQSAAKVDLEKGTITGYSSEQAEAAAAIAEGVASGVAKAIPK
jgi:hypothetical protein